MILKNLEQGSDAWLEFRRSHIGGSDCAAILGKSSYKGHTPYSVWRSKVLGENTFATPAMRRGTELEPIAREMIVKKSGLNFTPAVAVSEDRPWQMASLDGLSEDQSILLEIKCPGEKTLFRMFTGDEIVIPDDYTWQIQHQLAVTGCKEAILFIYDGTNGLDVRILPDPVMIEQLILEETNFWYSHVIEFNPPKLEKGDYVERIDEEWTKLAQERAYLQDSIEHLQALEKRNREALISLSKDHPSTGAGVTLYKTAGRTTIDYKSIPLLEDIDLTPYTKRGKEFWTIRMDKEKS